MRPPRLPLVLAVLAAALAALLLAIRGGGEPRPGAPEDVAALLDRAERLEAENAGLRARLEEALRGWAAADPGAPRLDGRPPPTSTDPRPEGTPAPPVSPGSPEPPLLLDGMAVPPPRAAAPEPIAALLADLQRRGLLGGALEDLIDDPEADPAARIGALLVLARAGDPLALEIAERLLDSRSEADHAVAESLLASVQGPADDAFLPLLRRRLAEAQDDPTRQRWMDTIARVKGPAWGTRQMVGEPDTVLGGDIKTAWASARADMGEVTVEVDFPVAVVPDQVRVHETLAPGAVARVEARTAGGAWVVLWEGVAPTAEAPAWFAPVLRATNERVRSVRLVLDTDRVTGWNEIDAVELVGGGMRQWASEARASSTYGGS